MAAGELLLQRVVGQLQAAVRQPGAAGQGVVDVIQAQDVPPGQAGGFGGAVQAQQARPAGGGIRIQRRRRPHGGPIISQKRFEQAGLTLKGVDGEVAGDGHPAHPAGVGGRVEQPGVIAQHRTQAFQRASGQGVQAGAGVVIVHAPHCGTGHGRRLQDDAESRRGREARQLTAR